MQRGSTMVPEKPVVPIGELSAVQRRVVQTLIAGASMAAAAVPNRPKNEGAAASMRLTAAAEPEVCHGRTSPTA